MQICFPVKYYNSLQVQCFFPLFDQVVSDLPPTTHDFFFIYLYIYLFLFIFCTRPGAQPTYTGYTVYIYSAY